MRRQKRESHSRASPLRRRLHQPTVLDRISPAIWRSRANGLRRTSGRKQHGTWRPTSGRRCSARTSLSRSTGRTHAFSFRELATKADPASLWWTKPPATRFIPVPDARCRITFALAAPNRAPTSQRLRRLRKSLQKGLLQPSLPPLQPHSSRPANRHPPQPPPSLLSPPPYRSSLPTNSGKGEPRP